MAPGRQIGATIYNAGMATRARADLRVRQRAPVSPRTRAAQLPPGLEKYLQSAEAALAAPFKGITTDGRVVPGLFTVERTGISTQPLVDAALALIGSLSAEQ